MRKKIYNLIMLLMALAMILWAVHSEAAVFIQCPCIADPENPPAPDPITGNIECLPINGINAACKQLTAGDGFIKMADGADMYIFGFHDVTGIKQSKIMEEGMLAQEFSAPTIKVKEGQDFYLSLTNVGMVIRPDLFDPHSVHWHGFSNAASIFDGEPMASAPVNMGATLTYYYKAVIPGTYMYHCHVEAPEHMQMGMLGNLYMESATPNCAYDGAPETCFDVEYPIEIVAFDPRFHEADETIQPLPFAAMDDTYPMLNGRGYPDTVNPADILNKDEKPSQRVPALITATKGQRILLRIASLSTTSFHSLTVLGIPMRVVGKDARALNFPYTTNSVFLGGGESADVILDTSDPNILPGTYFLYVTNMEHLNNNTEEYGGMMTEIILN
jgi:FtsP/CotA-like multicopper oxidase with cupredoxin domain